jgi:hypothetical protein
MLVVFTIRHVLGSGLCALMYLGKLSGNQGYGLDLWRIEKSTRVDSRCGILPPDLL